VLLVEEVLILLRGRPHDKEEDGRIGILNTLKEKERS
jgi:hypothetical protein